MGPRMPGGCRSSVRAGVVDLEVVELTSGAVAFEFRGISIAQAGVDEQRAQLGDVVIPQLLLDAIRAEAPDVATHVHARLIDGVAERLARIAADNEPAGLRH